MTSATTIADAEWFGDPALRRILAVLNEGDAETRIVGGAVRNTLMGMEVGDIDLATTLSPDAVADCATAAGFKTIPTGVDHGTVTVVVDGKPFEVTTLRVDVETDGRRAQVSFASSWREDAERRDLTINGLYADADGGVIDLIGGLADIEKRLVRFIGDAETRIREDYLRILRFFRFFAWYGDGRPDADGLRASARLKDGLAQLSAERVWSELKRLLAAPDPSRALLWMRQSGVLTAVLPETEKWGIDAIHGLVRAEQQLGWEPDALLRLMAITPPYGPRMAGLCERLKLSNAEKDRLIGWADAERLAPTVAESRLARLLYQTSPGAVIDGLRLQLAGARAAAETDNDALIQAAGYSRLIAFCERWERPVMPVRGKDLTALGVQAGPEMGRILKAIEEAWIASDFRLDRTALLEMVPDIQARTGD
ncbi:CCA tRNA nucleotidyltransferase [Hoeflea sp. CAU 1731]